MCASQVNADPALLNHTFRSLRERGALRYLSLEQKEEVYSEIHARHPDLDWASFAAVLGTVGRILDHAHELGDKLHDGRLQESEALEQLRVAFPGLEPDVLDLVYGQGLYESSK